MFTKKQRTRKCYSYKPFKWQCSGVLSCFINDHPYIESLSTLIVSCIVNQDLPKKYPELLAFMISSKCIITEYLLSIIYTSTLWVVILTAALWVESRRVNTSQPSGSESLMISISRHCCCDAVSLDGSNVRVRVALL